MSRMMLAAMTGRETVVQVFTVGNTWTAPLTTNKIRILTGKGEDGIPVTPTNASALIAEVNYYASGSGATGGVETWSGMQFLIGLALDAFNSGGAGSYFHQFVIQYSNTSYTRTNTSTSVPSGVNAGSASMQYGGAWGVPGNAIVGDGTATINWQYNVPATTGGNATAFGFTFSGGFGVPAVPVTHMELDVTPGAAYTIVVPAGGSVSLTYEK